MSDKVLVSKYLTHEQVQNIERGMLSLGFNCGPTIIQAIFSAALHETEAAPEPVDCSRIHPHENIGEICKLKTQIAKLQNKIATMKPVSADPVDDIAASGRDWLPLHPRPPAPKPVSASGLVYQLRILADYFYESEDGGEKCELIARAAQELEELKRKELPNEHGKNRYGVDMAYFRKTINRELNRPLIDFRPDELARVFARLSVTADSSVIFEDEFQRRKTPEPESADHIPDAGKMVVSAEPVEMPYLLRKGGMWYAHNSSGYTARAELAELYTKEYAESYANNHDEVSAVPLNEIIKSADQLNPYIERIKAMHDALEYATKPSPPE